MFQSSPGLVTGRYVILDGLTDSFIQVSILARSGDRALPLASFMVTENSLVSILARSGDRALRDQFAGILIDECVSILARSGDRALQSSRY